MQTMRKIADESGQMILLTSVSLFVVLGMLGFAIDIGHFRYVKRNLQSAADAAAIAAALEIRICGTTSNCAVMQTAAKDALTENGLSADSVLTNCSGTPGDGVTLMINNPTCEISSDPNTGKADYVEAIVSEKVPTYFAGLVGVSSEMVSARAEAARIGGPCIVALGGPPGGPYTDNAALSLVAGALVRANCPVWDESTNSNALECGLSVGLSAPQINVSGGVSGLFGILPSLCGLWTTRANTNVPGLNPHDPMSYLPAPNAGNDPNYNNGQCGGGLSGSTYSGSSSQVNITPVSLLTTGNNVTFQPGVYCGGISITASALMNITFEPGTYILTQTSSGLLGTGVLGNGGLNITVSALSTIQGQGVTFYSEGGPSTITVPSTLGLSNFNLSAPTNGEFGGVLFDQSSTNTSADSFLVSLAQGGILNGAIYAPNASVNYAVTALSSSYNSIVARDINFGVAALSQFGNDYSALSGGSPMNGNDVMLVQ